MNVKVTDYIATLLIADGVEQVFMVTGGGAMHLNDSLGSKLNCLFNHHEQASAIAAEGYARTSGKMAVVNVTTGPGGLNTLTGVMGQWTDSVPVLYISGQVKQETTLHNYPESSGLRQLGDQEVDIIAIVKPITKFAYSIKDPNEVKKVIEQAIYEAKNKRPGPVWIDVPMDIQGAYVNPDKLVGFVIPKKQETTADTILKKVADKLINAKRPVILAGHGIRIANAVKEFKDFLKQTNIPVVTTFNGIDILEEEHPNYVGRFGTLGTRAGNFTVQNADVLITIGTRNNIRQVSYNWEYFAREAFKIVVDIDPVELQKPTVKPDLGICIDAKAFIHQLKKETTNHLQNKDKEWLSWSMKLKEKYPSVLEEYSTCNKVHPYYFFKVFGETIPDNAIVVAGDGTACVVPFQAMKIKRNQRVFWNSGCASMGYDLPAAIGASVANKHKKQIICLAGDGSLQMNIQELQTVIHHQMPIVIFYLNNDGYVSIKQTQDGFFGGNRIGSDPKSGVSFPNIQKIGQAYGWITFEISSHDNLAEKIKEMLNIKGPVICEVKLTLDYKFLPKVASKRLSDGKMASAPLEDLAPFLPREEFLSNLFIKEINHEY